MNDKHTPTPGPWEVEMAEAYAVRDAQGGRVALMTHLKGPHGMCGRRSGQEVAANTLLVAAAPDLLEACRAIVEWEEAENKAVPFVDDGGKGFYQRIRMCQAAFDAARAAISRATSGEQT